MNGMAGSDWVDWHRICKKERKIDTYWVNFFSDFSQLDEGS